LGLYGAWRGCVKMGIFSPLIWPLYKSGAILPLLFIFSIIVIFFSVLHLISLYQALLIGIPLIIGFIVYIIVQSKRSP
jgi:hypothetical protein